MFTQGKAVESESRLVVAWSWDWEQGLTGKGHRSFQGKRDSKTGLW